MERYFISDPHFFHTKVLEYSKRPFKTVEKMNEAIIDNINLRVQPHDELYILGDFIWGTPREALNILRRINCQNLFYVFGNHDYKTMHDPQVVTCFKKMGYYLEIRVKDRDTDRGEQFVCLSHYPMIEWNKAHHGSWMLHGHCHGKLQYPPSLKNARIMDVGVDPLKFMPISYTELKKKFKNCENIKH